MFRPCVLNPRLPPSLQNWAAQDSDQYVFLSLKNAREQAIKGWHGGKRRFNTQGLNISALQYSEERSYGWYWWYRRHSPSSANQLIMVGNQNLTRRTETKQGQPLALLKCPIYATLGEGLASLGSVSLNPN